MSIERVYETAVMKPNRDSNAIEFAARLLQSDEIVAIPTETVYGLAGNALSETAVRKIFEAKGRPQDNPLIIHISDFDMLEKIAANIPDTATRLAERFFPGPLTMILEKRSIVPAMTNCGLDTVAVRMPDNDTALALIKKCGFPLAAPSANVSGRPSPTSAIHVFNDLCGKIPLILDGGECKFGLESTVITFADGKIRILRPGAVTVEMLSEFAVTELDLTVLNAPDRDYTIISPGTKYMHYSPRADVVLVKSDSSERFNEYIKNIKAHSDKKIIAIIRNDLNPPPVDFFVMGDTASEQARKIFTLLRETDRLRADVVYIRTPEQSGLGLAVYNRLLRASGFTVVELQDI